MTIFKKSRVEPIEFPAFSPLKHISILRDDLIHPIVCGNKWRKLKYVVEHFQKNNFETLVTFGGAYSNHVVATAFAGHNFNIKTHAFIRGDEPRELNHYEKLCIENKMVLTHCNRTVYRNKKNIFLQYYGGDPKAFFLDEGGSHPLALQGCSEIIEELNEVYDYIILPLGTGTTMEGLLQGIEKKKLPTIIVGISSMKNNIDLNKRMDRFNNEKWRIMHNYHRGKYGSTDKGLQDFIRTFSAQTGVPLESVYTGKMVMGFIDLIEKNFFKPEDRILLVHTGGLLNS